MTFAHCVLNQQETLWTKPARLAGARSHFPFAVDHNEEVARGGRMPIAFPTYRRAHETKLRRPRHRRQAKRGRRRSVRGITKPDLDIFEVRFARVIGKESYVFHNVSKCSLIVSSAGDFTVITLPFFSLFDDFVVPAQAESGLRNRSQHRRVV